MIVHDATGAAIVNFDEWYKYRVRTFNWLNEAFFRLGAFFLYAGLGFLVEANLADQSLEALRMFYIILGVGVSSMVVFYTIGIFFPPVKILNRCTTAF